MLPNNYIRLRNHGALPFLTLDHGMTMSVYHQDPDGNGFEIQVDGFGDWPTRANGSRT
jgi:catechol 2,3-dioxygenase